jgi:hypothetical protein
VDDFKVKKEKTGKTTRRNSVLRSELREVKRGLDKKLIIPQNDVSIFVRFEAFKVITFKTWSIVL